MNKNLVKKIAPRAGVVAAVATPVALWTTNAFALSTDPTGGMSASVQTQVTDYVKDYGAPALAAIVGLGIVIRVAVKYARKGGSAA